MEDDDDFIEHDGKKYVRATRTLQPFTNFSHIDEKVLSNKCNIGTKVHNAIDADMNGEFCVTDYVVSQYFCSYLRFMDCHQPSVIAREKRYFCDDYRFTGQIDCLMNLQFELVLVDWKTSVSESPTWEMQGHLYHYLISKTGQEISDRVLFVKLYPGPKDPKVFEYKISQNIMNKSLKAVKQFWDAHDNR